MRPFKLNIYKIIEAGDCVPVDAYTKFSIYERMRNSNIVLRMCIDESGCSTDDAHSGTWDNLFEEELKEFRKNDKDIAKNSYIFLVIYTDYQALKRRINMTITEIRKRILYIQSIDELHEKNLCIRYLVQDFLLYLSKHEDLNPEHVQQLASEVLQIL